MQSSKDVGRWYTSQTESILISPCPALRLEDFPLCITNCPNSIMSHYEEMACPTVVSLHPGRLNVVFTWRPYQVHQSVTFKKQTIMFSACSVHSVQAPAMMPLYMLSYEISFSLPCLKIICTYTLYSTTQHIFNVVPLPCLFSNSKREGRKCSSLP